LTIASDNSLFVATGVAVGLAIAFEVDESLVASEAEELEDETTLDVSIEFMDIFESVEFMDAPVPVEFADETEKDARQTPAAMAVARIFMTDLFKLVLLLRKFICRLPF
jgi:hypothetical protein